MTITRKKLQVALPLVAINAASVREKVHPPRAPQHAAPVAVLFNKAMIEIPPRFAGRPPVNPEARREQRLMQRQWLALVARWTRPSC